MTEPFRKGEVYFRIKYADRARKYPLIESFVFVGKNLSDEDIADTWYFQFADSFAKFGSVLEGPGGDRRVCEVSEKDLVEMLDYDTLCRALIAASERRQNT